MKRKIIFLSLLIVSGVTLFAQKRTMDFGDGHFYMNLNDTCRNEYLLYQEIVSHRNTISTAITSKPVDFYSIKVENEIVTLKAPSPSEFSPATFNIIIYKISLTDLKEIINKFNQLRLPEFYENLR